MLLAVIKRTWKLQGLSALVIFLAVSVSMLAKQILRHSASPELDILIWPVSGVSLALTLCWGIRILPGLFAGCLLAFLMWASPLMAAVYSVDDSIQLVLAYFLIKQFWPRDAPLVPSAKFLSLLLILGSLIPALLVSLVTSLFAPFSPFSDFDYWTIYLKWSLGEFSGTLVVAPLVLLILKPSFRQGVRRPLELSLYVILGLLILSLGISHTALTTFGLAPLQWWTFFALNGFIIVTRCGVGGVIVTNAVLGLTGIVSTAILCHTPDFVLSGEPMVEFQLFATTLMGVTLLIAAGFYDHAQAETLMHERSKRILEAQETERRRLTADLHDGPIQLFGSALAHLQSALSRTSDNGRDDLHECVDAISHGLRELRETVAGLHPEMLHQSPFAAVLENLCLTAEERSRVEILFDDESGGRTDDLPLRVREHLYRMAQEAIANAIGHGKPTLITVSLFPASPVSMVLSITDNGAGFLPASFDNRSRPHLGLMVMKERAHSIGGKLSIDSSPGRGTSVKITIPLSGKEEDPTPSREDL